MNSKLYVGNLSYDIRNADLEQLFSGIGSVKSVNVIMDNMTGKAKGFGFVEMNNSSDAATAISDLDGKDFMGRPLKVNAAKENTERNNNRSRY